MTLKFRNIDQTDQTIQERKSCLGNMKSFHGQFESAHDSLNPQTDQLKILPTIFRVYWVQQQQDW